MFGQKRRSVILDELREVYDTVVYDIERGTSQEW